MRTEVLPNGTKVHLTNILPRLAEVQIKLAKLQKELAELIEQVSLAGFAFPMAEVNVGPAPDPGPQTIEEVMSIWKKWAETNQTAPSDEAREKVRKQMEETARLSAESVDYLRQTVEAVRVDRPPPVMPRPAPGKVGPPPGDRDEKMRKVAAVLMANGVALGVLDPRAPVLQFALVEHKNTTDVKELFDETFGVGQYTMEESRNPDAPPADLRKRPDLIPKKEAPVLFTPVPPGYGLDIVAGDGALRPPVTLDGSVPGIPPTFDGSTGVPRVAGVAGKERIPNSGE